MAQPAQEAQKVRSQVIYIKKNDSEESLLMSYETMEVGNNELNIAQAITNKT